jgi:hypothetical protein
MSRTYIKSVGFPLRETYSLLRPVKDDLRLRALGEYSISGDCDQIHIGQTDLSIDSRF